MKEIINFEIILVDQNEVVEVNYKEEIAFNDMEVVDVSSYPNDENKNHLFNDMVVDHAIHLYN